jgi:deoxyribonucleoside regulator
MYYEEGRTQDEIAREFGTSRSTISRVLKRARDLGIVRFTIVDPNSMCSQVAVQLRKRLNLHRVVVVEGDPDSDDLTRRDLGIKSAELLVRLVQDNQTIGTCWGSTIYEMVRALTPKPVSRVRVVQFVGTVGGLLAHTHADQLPRMIAQAFNGEWHVLPAPAVVQNGDSLQTFLDEPQIKRVLELGKQSDIALVGIGVCDENALLARAGYITKSEMQQLRSLGAVGEIGCRFYDANGNQCRSDVDDRTISISLSDLKQIPIKIGIAAGLNKVPAIKGALAGGYVNILVTDLITAQALLDQCTASDSCELC